MAGVGLELEIGGDELRKNTKYTVADFRQWYSLITTYNHMNLSTAAGEVVMHKLQLCIIYHLLFSPPVCVDSLDPDFSPAPCFRKTASDWTWKPVDFHKKTRGQFECYNLSKKLTFAKAKLLPSRKSKGQAWRQPRRPFLVVVRLLWQNQGGFEPGLRQTSHDETWQSRVASPFLSFSLPPNLTKAGAAADTTLLYPGKYIANNEDIYELQV